MLLVTVQNLIHRARDEQARTRMEGFAYPLAEGFDDAR